MRVLPLIVACLWMLACSSDPPSDIEDAESCLAVQKRSDELLRSHQGCVSDEECVVGELEVPCIERFWCTQAWRKDTNVKALKQSAMSLRSEYERSCHTCATTSCAFDASEAHAFCDSETKLCTYYSRRTAGADAGAIALDGGTGDPQASLASPYTCQDHADCVIKQVGGCCSYRCANVSAAFEAASCPGVGCDDGHKSYDRCECQQNVCRTLFGDAAVY